MALIIACDPAVWGPHVQRAFTRSFDCAILAPLDFKHYVPASHVTVKSRAAAWAEAMAYDAQSPVAVELHRIELDRTAEKLPVDETDAHQLRRALCGSAQNARYIAAAALVDPATGFAQSAETMLAGRLLPIPSAASGMPLVWHAFIPHGSHSSGETLATLYELGGADNHALHCIGKISAATRIASMLARATTGAIAA